MIAAEKSADWVVGMIFHTVPRTEQKIDKVYAKKVTVTNILMLMAMN